MSLSMKKIMFCLSVVLPGAVNAGLVLVDEPAQKKLSAPSVQALLSEALAAQTPATPPLPVKIIPKEVWIAERGSSLRQSLEAWSKKAKWNVVFDIGKIDYDVSAPLRFEGNFDEAAAQFIRLYERAEKPLVADISLRQSLIYVTTRK